MFSCPSDTGDPYLPDDGTYGIKAGSGYLGVKTNYDFCTPATEYCNHYWPGYAWLRMFGDGGPVGSTT